jgi:hypothetical protein
MAFPSLKCWTYRERRREGRAPFRDLHGLLDWCQFMPWGRVKGRRDFNQKRNWDEGRREGGGGLMRAWHLRINRRRRGGIVKMAHARGRSPAVVNNVMMMPLVGAIFQESGQQQQ